ncbi:SapC family protein [Ruegeria sp. R14_0]|uniref:SapC family protein n=1 Tax=Ruegeria sp. R14_0 TaxID=2821100 RepID=UPI001ADD38EB|nr:SapC family protein [Ruegeria sp. R14_0]MBO9447512.1 SapC family protein [Ruegeria sp. R14_0]
MAQNGLFPVTYNRYGHRYWKRFSSFHFARHQHLCPVVAQEVLHIAAAYPMVFHETNNWVEPVAILSLSPHTPTPFVSDNGRWLATYIPSALRCPPFHTVRSDPCHENSLQLMVDETLGLVTDSPGNEPFFTDSGELTEELQKVLSFFQTRETSAFATRRTCRTLQDLGLFTRLTVHDGVDLPAATLGVDMQRLNALSQSEKLTLLETGALQLVHAHQVSLSHLAWFSIVQKRAARTDTQKQYTENSDVSLFLTAMAHAQNEDRRLIGEV